MGSVEPGGMHACMAKPMCGPKAASYLAPSCVAIACFASATRDAKSVAKAGEKTSRATITARFICMALTTKLCRGGALAPTSAGAPCWAKENNTCYVLSRFQLILVIQDTLVNNSFPKPSSFLIAFLSSTTVFISRCSGTALPTWRFRHFSNNRGTSWFSQAKISLLKHERIFSVSINFCESTLMVLPSDCQL